MYPIAIAVADGTAAALRDRLAADLSAHGSVAVVGRDGSTEERPPLPEGATVAYRLGERGTWTATGDGSELSVVLDRLAPAADYVLVSGVPDADLPHVVVGEAAVDGPVLLSADRSDAIAAEAVIEALEDVEPHETLESLVARVKGSPDADRAGAIATFTGRVRAKDGPDDPPTTRLEFEKYAGVAEERMDAIRTDLEDRDGVFAVAVHHRTGIVESGEDIVFVVVLAGHREEAFRTVEDGINRLKAEVPLFKKEVTVDETFWVHDRT